MRLSLRLAATLAALVLAAPLLPVAAASRRPAPAASSNTLGFGVGALWPQGSTADLYGVDWAGTVRGLYFGGAHLGARSALFYGRAKGKSGIEDGNVYGLDLDLAVRFGQKAGGFYVFAGPGFYWTHFNQVSGAGSGDTTVRVEDSAVSASAGFGYSYKAFFVEASYVNVFSQGDDVRYVPVMIGFQF